MSSKPVYFEKQASALCGQHALNNLVQRPSFSVENLAQIAQFLDAQERRVMGAGAGGFGGESSSNVSEAGDFSVQVLSEALRRDFGCRLVPIGNEEVRSEAARLGLDHENGFIINRREHWFALRKIRGKLWSLDSMADRPTLVSPFALDALVNEYSTSGSSVFVVRGNDLPEPVNDGDTPDLPKFSNESKWFEEDYLLRLERGQAATDWGILGKGQRLDGSSSANGGQDESEDAQLARAIALSMQQQQQQQQQSLLAEPDVSESNTVRIQLRLPGAKVVRRFRKADSALQLWSFVSSALVERGMDGCNFSLIGAGGPPLDPEKASSGTIDSEGLGGSSILVRLL
jgi:ataxin-3